MINKVQDHFFKFVFNPRNPQVLAWGRIVVFISFWWFFKNWSYSFQRYMTAAEDLYVPISYFKFFPQLHLSASTASFVTALWQISLLSSALGFLTRVSTKIAFFTSLLIVGYDLNFGKVDHSSHIPMLVMGILAFSRCGDVWSLDALLKKYILKIKSISTPHWEYSWPIRMIQVAMALSYLEAGLQKLYHAGFSWMSAENMTALLLTRPTVTPLGLWIASHPVMSALSGISIVTFQLSGAMALFFPWMMPFSALGLSMFHIMSYVLMGNHGWFLPYVPCFIFWLPLDRWFRYDPRK